VSTIHFTIEYNARPAAPPSGGRKLAELGGVPVYMSHGRRARFHLEQRGRRRLCVLGHPIIDETIDNGNFPSIYMSAERGPEFFRSLNGEFLLVEVDEARRSIRVVNSRFASPIFFYVAKAGFFLGSTSYYELCLRLRELGMLRMSQEPFYEFLNFRRVFGEKTYDRDSLYLRPANVLTFNCRETEVSTYWTPSYEKNSLSLGRNSDRLIEGIRSSIKRKTSDGRRYGMFLSGGMDTRTVLANFGEDPPHCFTLTYSQQSREYQVARRLAGLKGAGHTWIQVPERHDRRFLEECARLTGSMYMTPATFLGHGDAVAEEADVLFAGYGFDYFFQGMYIPSTSYRLFGKKIHYRRPQAITGDMADHFISNVSYRTKGAPVDSLMKGGRRRQMDEYLRAVVGGIVSEAIGFSDDSFDIWEYINFSNLSRHYTYGGQLELMTLAEYRTISYDNDIYDHYLSLPVEQRFDARVMREALRRVSPQFYNLESANTGMPVGYSAARKTVFQVADYLKRRAIFKGQPELDITPQGFKRTWLPTEAVLRYEMPDYVAGLKNSPELDSVGIFDMDKVRTVVDMWLDGRVVGDQTLLLLLTIERFLRNVFRGGRNGGQ
jgi:asparagine synthase (glutamine-hydrolysing)